MPGSGALAVSKAVITAAGLGTRMWPATKVCPKELFPLGRIPIIIHIVWELMEAGIDDIVIVAHEGNVDSIRYLLDPGVQAPENQAADPLVQRFNDTVH